MCATRVDKGEAVLFRSYTPPSDAGLSDFKDVDVVSAACATSAAPTFLPSVEINGVDFWDGGLLNNNPINQVWNARYDLAPPLPPVNEVAEEPVVACVVSIGTGCHRKTRRAPKGILGKLSTAISYTMNTKAKDEDFRHSLERLNLRKSEDQRTVYFRLDAPIRESINIDDWQKMRTLEEDTNTWLRTKEGQEIIKKCARLLSYTKYTKPH
jgi:predicted acylesterase/phospholipase RssA